MRIRNFQIAGGNDTALVWGAEPEKIKDISKKLLNEVEQVGFIQTKKTGQTLYMMGGELCINAALAAAFAEGKEGKISLGNTRAFFKAGDYEAEIALSLPYKRTEKVVIFEKIGYRLTYDEEPANKPMMRKLCRKYGLPAFGLIKISGSSINPVVYVRQTDSLVNETACGSGSIAAFILTGKTEIVQPTGQIINVNRKKSTFIISANVFEITK